MNTAIIIAAILVLVFSVKYFVTRKAKSYEGNSVNFDKLPEDLKKTDKNNKLFFYFYSQRCSACRQQKPILEEVFGENSNLIKIDIVKDLATAKEFGIMGTPTMAVVQNGNISEILVGFQNKKKLLQKLNELN